MNDRNHIITKPSSLSKGVTDILQNLEVGQSYTWPLEKVTTVRSLASQVGLRLDRVFKTFSNRTHRKVVVTRMS